MSELARHPKTILIGSSEALIHLHRANKAPEVDISNLEVENNTLQFEILEASVNDLTIPPATYAVIETTINQTLSEAMGQIPSSVTLTGVSVGEGTLTVTANIQR